MAYPGDHAVPAELPDRRHDADVDRHRGGREYMRQQHGESVMQRKPESERDQ